jgi:hypothetical protein
LRCHPCCCPCAMLVLVTDVGGWGGGGGDAAEASVRHSCCSVRPVPTMCPAKPLDEWVRLLCLAPLAVMQGGSVAVNTGVVGHMDVVLVACMREFTVSMVPTISHSRFPTHSHAHCVSDSHSRTLALTPSAVLLGG